MLLHVAHSELAAWYTGHHIFSTVEKGWVRDLRIPGYEPPMLQEGGMPQHPENY